MMSAISLALSATSSSLSSTMLSATTSFRLAGPPTPQAGACSSGRRRTPTTSHRLLMRAADKPEAELAAVAAADPGAESNPLLAADAEPLTTSVEDPVADSEALGVVQLSFQ